jgi:hypothetical protein
MIEIAPGIVWTRTQWKNFCSKMLLSEDGCIVWQGRVDKDGYPLFDIGKKTYRAHRLILIVSTGVDREEMEAAHLCDNPPCVNADHLYWGTRSENMKDRRDAGHQAGGRQSANEKMRRMFDE